MQFSVLMSVYKNDDPEGLRMSLDSIVNQTIMPSEIVIVLDGPVPRAIEATIYSYAEKYVNLIRTIPLEQNMGLGKALNIGLANCKFDIVARMDADDISKPYRFERQINFLKSNDDVDVVGSWIEEFQHSLDNIVSLRKVPETNEEIYNFAKVRSPFNHPTVVFRKQSILEVGSYTDYGTFEDYHLWARLILAGKKCYNIQESLLYFKINESTYKRRGGWRKAIAEVKLQQYFLSLGFINISEFIYNVFARGGARIIPNNLRILLYKHALSTKIKK